MHHIVIILIACLVRICEFEQMIAERKLNSHQVVKLTYKLKYFLAKLTIIFVLFKHFMKCLLKTIIPLLSICLRKNHRYINLSCQRVEKSLQCVIQYKLLLCAENSQYLMKHLISNFGVYHQLTSTTSCSGKSAISDYY